MLFPLQNLGACDSGWREYEGTCYRYFDSEVSYAMAKGCCASHNALLVKVDTQEKDEFVYDLVSETRSLNYCLTIVIIANYYSMQAIHPVLDRTTSS
jgi:hypothetical protein